GRGGGGGGGGTGGGGGGGGTGGGGGGGGRGGGGGGGGGGGRSGASRGGGSGGSARGGGGYGSGPLLPRLSDTPNPQQLHVFALDFAAINKGIYAMYVDVISAEGACYLCVPCTASESAAALGASKSAATLGASASAATGASESATSESDASESATSAEALHTFTLDSGASRCFFRDCTTVTPLAAPVPVSLADPFGGPVVARASTVLPCLAVPSGSLLGLHLPTFLTNLVSNTAIQDVWVDTFTPGGQRVAICARTGRHLAKFTRQSGSSLYTLTNASAQVAASSKVSASSQLATSCSSRVLSHQTLLWHHRLGHPSLPRLRSMHSRLLVYDLPRSCPPSRARLPRRAFPALRGGSAPLLIPPFLRPLLLSRLSTWTCGARSLLVGRTRSATSCWWLTTTRAPPRSSLAEQGGRPRCLDPLDPR
ncbi:unnamed protein product, partial [Closterium sp. NIES-54]